MVQVKKSKSFWQNHIDKKDFKLKNFRDHTNKEIFSTWSPYKRGLIYHNFLINNYIKNFPEKKFIKLHKDLKLTNIGNAPSILFNGNEITLDDCWTLEEIKFLEKKIKNNSTILEIGAGYGRTANSLLKYFNLKNYFIIDLKKTLVITKKYLKTSLSTKEYDKIIFINYEDFLFKKNYLLEIMQTFNKKFKNFDLVINIDSFQEMEKNLINNYLDYFSKITNNFYFKNAICKYYPRDMVDHRLKNIKISKDVCNLGLQNDYINIFDSKELHMSTIKTIKLYNPDKKNFKFDYQKSLLFDFYVHAFYSKS